MGNPVVADPRVPWKPALCLWAAIAAAGLSSPPTEAQQAPPVPRTAAEFLARGDTYLQQRDYDLAIADYSKAISLDPRSAKAYAARARAWGARHYRDREINDLETAIQLDPRNAAYRIARAESWSAQGRHDQAMVDYDQGIRLDPSNPQYYVARGNEWRRDLKLDLAVADYDQAIRLDPRYTHAYVCRALVARQRQDHVGAVAQLSAVASRTPDDAEVHATLARMLATSYNEVVRNGPLAVREATRACELTRWNDPDCLDTLAAAYAEAGDYQSAVAWQTRAIAAAKKSGLTPLQRTLNFGGRRGVGFDDRLAFYKRKRPTRE